ncbi:MAG: DUF2905 domain-containing protein [Thermodesulfobacteriota bacterium]
MLARMLIIIGVLLIISGIIFGLAPKIPILGKLPGDIYFRKGNFSFYFPLATSIIISALISVLLYFFTRH